MLADGFFEWKKIEGGKTPMYLRLRSGSAFGFAGLWEQWKSPDGELLESCTIVTAPANELVAPIHERMPVILTRSARAPWLNPERLAKAEAVRSLVCIDASELEAFEVAPIVNSPRNDVPETIKPV